MPKYLLKEKYIAFGIGAVLMLVITAVMNFFVNYTTQPLLFSLFAIPPPPNALTISVLFSRSLDGLLFNLPAMAAIALSAKLLKHCWLKQKETQQLITSKTGAELQLLKAQVHPHFLFNTLNNIYSFTLNASPIAPEIVKKLSGLLHYIIHECDQPLMSLEKEFKMLQDYMALEKIRYGEQMDMTIDIRGNYSDKMIAPLLLIPFVENSFKHGTSKMLSKPWVNLNIIIENSTLYFMLNNSKPEDYVNSNGKNGIGLANVQKRLQLLYPCAHELKMTSEPGYFTALLEIDLQTKNEKAVENSTRKKVKRYEPV